MYLSITPTEPSREIHPGTEQGSPAAGAIRFPFAAVVGHQLEKRALLLLAIEPNLRGVLIATASDANQSALARDFGSMVAPNDDREPGAVGLSSEAELEIIQLPISITEDRLLGGLDLERTLATGRRQVSQGLLARAHGRVLFVDNVTLLEANTAAHIGHALDLRCIRIEREGVSAVHESNFRFIGTFDPADGEPSPMLRDRLGLIANSVAERLPAETADMIERTFQFDHDPFAFAEDFAFETAAIKSAIETARELLPQIKVSREHVRQIALVAMKLGVEGNRADIFALKAARANAALSGRDAVNEDDLVIAIQLVLAPRAITLPLSKEEVESAEVPSEQDLTGEGQAPESRRENSDRENSDREREALSDSIEDFLLKAIDAHCPEEALSALQRTGRTAKTRTGKRFKGSTATRGRYVGSTDRRNCDARVAVDATLRAAAPFQLRRRNERDLTNAPPEEDEGRAGSLADFPAPRVKIRSDDLRFKQFRHRSGILFILAVDSSGSMAFNRMAQAKGALSRLLQRAYLQRDQVSLISFRGASAEVLLAPTRSVELARRLLDALPAGGGTPLSAGVIKAIELARFARLRGTTQAILVLFTDGRANVPLQGIQGGIGASAIEDELRRLGALLEREGITSVVVDTKSRFLSNGEGNSLARMLGARYVYLPSSDAALVHKAIVSAAASSQR